MGVSPEEDCLSNMVLVLSPCVLEELLLAKGLPWGVGTEGLCLVKGGHHNLRSHLTGGAARGEERESKNETPEDAKTSTVTWLLDRDWKKFPWLWNRIESLQMCRAFLPY